MLPRLFAPLGLIAALTAPVVSCKDDPTAEGVGTPVAVNAELASLNVAVGASGTFAAYVVDVRTNRLDVPITFGPCNAAIATVAADPAFDPVPHTSAQAVVTGVAPGTTCALVMSSGLTPDTVQVIVH